MEAEGWMQHLFPAWTTASADAASLEEMRKLVTQLQMQGVSPDISAASAQFLTAKLAPKELAALKALMVRPGFVEEWNNIDHAAREFSKHLMGKEAATPSATWKLFTSADPQAVLWLGLTSKTPAVQAKYKNFFTVWPEARQKIPYALFQEMRITPEVPNYDEMISRLFLGVIDGELETDEQLRAFLEPYSPPAPPPPVTVRRTRGSRKGGEAKSKVAAEAAFDGESGEAPDVDALELDDEEAVEEPIEDLDEEENEPPVSLPPAAKKTTAVARKSAVETVSTPAAEKPAAKDKPEKGHVSAVAAVKTAKVHVMAKPGKAVAPPAVAHAASHPAKPAHPAAPVHAAPAKKPSGVKQAPAKSAAKPILAKAVPARPVRRPAAKPTPVKSAKSNIPAKKTAAKPVAKPHKKAEAAKKAAPPKKAVPARKHR
jgi:hypothetical protein